MLTYNGVEADVEGTGEEIWVNSAPVSLLPITLLLTWREGLVDGEMTLMVDCGSLELVLVKRSSLSVSIILPSSLRPMSWLGSVWDAILY